MKVMVIVKASRASEAGEMPSEKLLTEMGAYNEQLVNAGIMLAGEGLHPSSRGHRVRFEGAKRTVTDGPFAETKEYLMGFWILDVKTPERMVEIAARISGAPGAGGAPMNFPVEVRPVGEAPKV